MDQVAVWEQKADRAAFRSKTAAGIASVGFLYGLCSLGNGEHPPYEGTPYGTGIGWLLQGAHIVNQAVSFGIEAVTHAKMPPDILGLAIGEGVALTSGLYAWSRRKKMSEFRALAEECRNRGEENSSPINGLNL